jgi:hypothetical protein
MTFTPLDQSQLPENKATRWIRTDSADGSRFYSQEEGDKTFNWAKPIKTNI